MEGTDNGQMTPHGYSNFNSYIKDLGFIVFRGWTDGQTDRQMDGDINLGGGAGCRWDKLLWHKPLTNVPYKRTFWHA
jgi:hypothetical protein